MTFAFAATTDRLSSSRPAVLGGWLVVAFAVATVCAGCSSTRKLKAIQSVGESDPATGGSLELLDPDSPAAMALRSSGDPSAVGKQMRLGETALQRGQFEQARTHFEAVLAEQPQHAKAHHGLAVIADNLGQFEQSETHYRIALDQSGEDAELLGDLGYSYFLQQRFDEAETYLKRARAVDPTYERAIGNLIVLYRDTGNREKCLAMCRLTASEEDAQKTVARLFAERGELDPLGTQPMPLAERSQAEAVAPASESNETIEAELAQLKAEVSRLKTQGKQDIAAATQVARAIPNALAESATSRSVELMSPDRKSTRLNSSHWW